MVKADQPARLAVLIDAENISPKIVDGLLEAVARLGQVTIRRIYGDFSKPMLLPWVAVAARHGIRAQLQVTTVPGKNASDIALVIDAMDLLHSGRLDGICIVSSDSDFAGLAIRIRETGTSVYGFGERKTPEAFRQACDRFFFTEDMAPAPMANVVRLAPSTVKPPPALTRSTAGKALPLVVRALVGAKSTDGWVDVAVLGSALARLEPGFDPRRYGSARLSDLVRQTNAFDVEPVQGRGMRIRLKQGQPGLGKPERKKA